MMAEILIIYYVRQNNMQIAHMQNQQSKVRVFAL